MRLSDLDDWALRNHGLLTFDASGTSRSAWYRAIASGAIEQLHPFVARLHGTPDTPEQRIAAATLAAGGSALASHRSAARLWGIPRPDDDPVDLIARRTAGPMAMTGVVIHRPTDRSRLAPQRRQGIACTNILRTVLDLGAVDAGSVHQAVGHVLATGMADLGAIRAVLVEHGRPGRHGVRALRAALDEWSIDGKPADSLLEAEMRRLVLRHALPPVEFHPTIEGREVDFRVVGTRVILECDGWIHHGLDRATFERDRERDADLLAAGWVVVRFTYRAITTRPKATADRIRAAIGRWAATF